MTGGIIPSKRHTIWKRDGRCCHYCGVDLLFIDVTADHVWPVALGGVNANWNLVPACAPCNLSLGDRTDKCDCTFCLAAKDTQSPPETAAEKRGPVPTVAELAGWRLTEAGWVKSEAVSA